MTSIADQPSELEILQAARERWFRDVHTFMPGIVKSYTTALVPTAQVQLALQLEKPDGSLYTLPPIMEVPVCWPRGGGFALTMPLSPGDSVLVLFSEEDPAKWYTTGEVSPPEIPRRHGLYAFAVPGAFNETQTLATHQTKSDSAVLSATGGLGVRVGGTLVELGDLNGSMQFVALANLVATELSNMQAMIDGMKVTLNTHAHSGVTTGPGASGPLVVPFTGTNSPGSVAAVDTKAT